MSRGIEQIGLNKRIPSHLESFEKTFTVAEEEDKDKEEDKEEDEEGEEGTLQQVMDFQNWNIKFLELLGGFVIFGQRQTHFLQS